MSENFFVNQRSSNQGFVRVMLGLALFAGFFLFANISNASTFTTLVTSGSISGYNYTQTDYLLNWSLERFDPAKTVFPAGPASTIISNGRAYTPSSLVSSNPYGTLFELEIPQFFNGDNATLEARIKNPYAEGAISARDVHIVIFGTQGYADVNFVDNLNLARYAFIGAGQSIYLRSSSLVQSFNTYRNVTLKTSNNTVSVSIDGQQVLSQPYQGHVGTITKVALDFRGSASIDRAKISENNSLKAYESFDVTGTTTAKITLITGFYQTGTVQNPVVTTGSENFTGDTNTALRTFRRDIGPKPTTVHRKKLQINGNYLIQNFWNQASKVANQASKARAQFSAQAAKNPTVNQNDAADPVEVQFGAFTYHQDLMHIPGEGQDIDFEISYHNQLDYNGPLGHNFSHSYNILMGFDPDDDKLYYFDANADKYEMSEVAGQDGVYQNPGLRAKASFDLTKNLIVTFFDGSQQIFRPFYNDGHTIYKLFVQMDRYGNHLKFQYDDQAQLIGIIDTLGRNITLSYNGQGKLDEITDFNNKKIKFSYSTNDDLTTVTLNRNGQTKTIDFTYSQGFNVTTEDQRNHNILTLKDSLTQTYVTNVYDANDRVTSQQYGPGTYSYSYTTNAQGNITQTNVTNGRNIQTVYTFDQVGNVLSQSVQTPQGSVTSTFEYDTLGRLIRSTKPEGDKTTYQYDAQSNLTKITESPRPGSPLPAKVTTYSYDPQFNRPTSITAPNGQVTTLNVDQMGNVVGMSQAGIQKGDGTSFTVSAGYQYNLKGQLIKSIDPEGTTTNYAYTNGLVSSVTKGTNQTTHFAYDPAGNLTSVTDAEGNTFTYNYDAFDRLIKTQTPEGVENHYQYDANNNLVKHLRALGNGQFAETTLGYDLLDNPTSVQSDIDANQQASVQNTFDPHQNLISQINPRGTKTQIQYDNFDRVIQQTLSSGGQSITVSTQYDKNGLVTQMTDARGNVTKAVRDGFGRVVKIIDAENNYTTYSYDNGDNITQIKQFSAGNTLLAKTVITYNKLGRPLKTERFTLVGTKWIPNGTNYQLTTPATISNKAVYNKRGQVVLSKDGNNNPTITAYDTLGRVRTVTDALGNTTTYSYDKRNLVTQTVLAGNSTTYTTKYSYDNDGRLIRTTNNDNKTQLYLYNPLNQLTRTTDENGNNTDYSYDYRGLVLSETKYLDGSGVTTRYAYDNNGNLISLTDANNNTTTFNYDYRDQLIKQTYPDNKNILLSYDPNGNIATQTDPNGSTIRNTYDRLNRLTARSITLGQGVGGVTSESYQYDGLSRLLEGNDSQNAKVSFRYDGLSRLMQERNQGKILHYEYDANNNLTRMIYPSKKVETKQYDALDRLTVIDRTARGQTNNIIKNTYSTLTLNQTLFANGAKSTYGYDNLLRNSNITHFQSPFNSQNNALQILQKYDYSYDGVSNVLSNGPSNYQYDDLYRIVAGTYPIDQAGKQKAEARSYDPVGNRTLYKRDENRVTNQGSGTIPQPPVISGNPDNNGNHFGQINNGNNGKHLGQIKNGTFSGTSGSSGSSGSNGNNSNGNGGTNGNGGSNGNAGGNGNGNGVGNPNLLKFEGESAYTVNNLNQYTSLTYPRTTSQQQTFQLKYDNNGNLLEDAEHQYKYDYKNRLIRAKNTRNHQTVEYKYDVLGRRIEKLDKKLHKYIYTQQDIAEEDTYMNRQGTAGAIKVKEFVYGQGIDNIIYSELNKPLNYQDELVESGYTEVYQMNGFPQAVKRYFYQKDIQGSVTLITDLKGKIIEQYRYDAYGMPREKDGASLNRRPFKTSRLGNTRLYTARERDEELEVYYYRARYYDYKMGRFISRDPIGYADNVNLYAYVGNNPMSFVDPLGLKANELLASTKQKLQLIAETAGQVREDCKQNTDRVTLTKACVGGDFIREEKTLCDVAGQIVCGEIPLLPDARDLIAAVAYCKLGENCSQEIGLAGVGFVPAIGALKYGDELMELVGKYGKYTEKAAENGKEVVKHTSEVTESTKQVVKKSDEVNALRKQNKKLNNGEIKKLQNAGFDPEELKNHDAGLDIYKDKKGDLYIQRKPEYIPKGSNYEPEPLFLNIKQL